MHGCIHEAVEQSIRPFIMLLQYMQHVLVCDWIVLGVWGLHSTALAIAVAQRNSNDVVSVAS